MPSSKGLRFARLLLLAAGAAALLTGFAPRHAVAAQGRIVFALAGNIFVVNADGSRLRQITHSDAGQVVNQDPTWSRDGKWIYYVHLAPGTGSGLYRIDAEGIKPGARLTLAGLTASSIVMYPVWSPDGSRLALTVGGTGTYETWTYTRGGVAAQVRTGFAVHPTWSPDGKRIAYGGLLSVGQGSIFIVDSDGAAAHDVSHAPVDDETPVWSPDGKWIALRSLNRGWRQHEEDSLVLVQPSGLQRKTLVRGGVIFPVAWSPQSDLVLFWRETTPQAGDAQLYLVPATGGTPQPVPGTQGAVGGGGWHT